MDAPLRATARAHTNIALVKYWGKRDERLMLPMNGSLSLTLDQFYSTTTVQFEAGLGADTFTLNGQETAEADRLKVTRFLDRVRQMAGTALHASVTAVNHVPTAAGLASSASGFAALAAAAAHAAGLPLDGAALSRLARMGSGSACRSIYGGFVLWNKGERADGLDSHAVPVAAPEHWDLRLVAAVLAPEPKAISSRDGMRRTVETSPLYAGWLATVEADLVAARTAVLARDFDALGRVAERSAMKMHATTMGADPPFTYWQSATLAVMQRVHELRGAGVPAYFTIDAGPHVKVLCLPADAAQVQNALAAVPGVMAVTACRPGPGVTILPEGAQA